MNLHHAAAVIAMLLQQGVDLSFKPPMRRPLLIELTQEFDGLYTMRAAGERTEGANKSNVDFAIIEELTRWDEQGAEGTRLFVKTFKTLLGLVDDPPLNGLRTTFKRNGDQSAVEFAESRFLPKNDADGLVRMVDAAGIWLALPNQANVGDNYPIDLTPLTSLLLSNEVDKASGDVNVLFESFDATTGIARLRGNANLAEEGALKGLEIKIAYVGDTEIEVNPRERRIIKITLSGTYIAEGGTADGRVQYEEHGRFRAGIATRIGNDVAKAREQQVRFRERTFQIPKLDVSLVLPSCYTRVDGVDSQNVFQRMVRGDRLAMVSVDYLDGDTKNPQAYYDKLLAELKRQYSSVTTEKVSSPIGAGIAFVFTARIDGADQRTRSEVFPFGDRFLLLKLQADPDTLSTAMPEFAKARKTLTRVKK